MSLIKLSYSEYENEPRHWDISDATNAVVWNLMDENHCYKGQAAWFGEWEFL